MLGRSILTMSVIGIFSLLSISANSIREISAATPVASQEIDPKDVVLPEECQVEPRAIAELLSLIRQAYGNYGSPEPAVSEGSVVVQNEADPLDPLPGPFMVDVTADGIDWIVGGLVQSDSSIAQLEVADPKTSEFISVTIRQFTACSNAGDLHRLDSLLTDKMFIELIQTDIRFREQIGTDRSEAEWSDLLLADPVPRPDEYLELAPKVISVRLLSDGRAAAIVVPMNTVQFYEHNPGKLGVQLPPRLWVFARADEAWKVDDIVQLQGFA